MKENKDSKGLIQRLSDRYDTAAQNRKEKEEEERPLRDRLSVIFESAKFVNTDFWCNECKRDCSGTGFRQVCTVNEQWPTAWYTGYCPLGHKMIRRITDKGSDPYYEMSLMIQRQRYELRDAMLDPSDPRFKVVYPKQWEELVKKAKEYEEENARKTTTN
jgi:hypothetical protein